MTERPILFSAPMIRAILEGRKTQTRRIIKLPTKNFYEHPKVGGWAATTIGGGGTFRIKKDGSREDVPEQVAIWHQTNRTCIVPRIAVGDVLWVRETWKQALSDHRCAGYKADGKYQCGKDVPHPEAPFHKWRPSIHMPRWASRITLRVTGVKVERLQDISWDDCLAEGVEVNKAGLVLVDGGPPMTAKAAYRKVWEDINGPGSWDANPWVVAYTFERVK